MANVNALAAAYMAAGYGMVAPHMMHYPPGTLLLAAAPRLASVPVCVVTVTMLTLCILTYAARFFFTRREPVCAVRHDGAAGDAAGGGAVGRVRRVARGAAAAARRR